MARNNNENNVESNTTRRSFLGVVSGGLVLGGQMNPGTNDGNAHIVEMIHKEDGEIIEEVPESWIKNVYNVKQAQRKIEEKFLHLPGVKSVGRVRRDDKTFGGKNGLQVEVGINQNEIGTEIPDSIDGVPIRKYEEDVGELLSCDGNTGDYDPVNGGVICTAENGSTATTSFPVKKDGSKYMLCSGHQFDV